MKRKILTVLLCITCLLTGCATQTVKTESELPDPETAVFATMLGSSQEKLVEELFPNATVLRYEGFPDVMLALREGKADYSLVAEQLTRTSGTDTSAYVIVRDDVQSGQVGAAVVKGNTELRDKLNECIRTMKEDGTLEDMKERWIVPEGQYKKADLPVPDGDNGTLRVGTSAGYPPMEFVTEGKYEGFDIELATRMALMLDMKLEVTDIPFASLLAALNTGQIDVIVASMAITDERKQTVDFTDGYYEDKTVMIRYDAAAAKAPSFWDGMKESFRRTFVTENRWKLILSGLSLTLFISILFAFFGTILGFLMCLLRKAHNPIPRILIDGFCGIIRGVPMVVFLMVLNYVVFARSGFSGVAVSVIAFSLVFGCAVCGMLTVGLEGVDPGELEAGLALGYTPTQVFMKIGLPQAIRQVLPIYRGEFIGTMKLTSIVGYIAVQDLTKVGDLIRSRTLEAFFPLIVTALLYFLLSNVMSCSLILVEQWVDPKHRKRTIEGVRM